MDGFEYGTTNHSTMKGSRGGPRPGAGRKPTGKGIQVKTSIPFDDVAALDAWAAMNGCTRTEAVRRLTKIGLETEAKRRAKKPAS
jgi:hypothetical protein